MEKTKRKRSLKRIAIFAIISLLWVLLLLALFAPAILSTGAGRSVVEGMFNSRVKGSISIGALSLNWLSGQAVENLSLRDEAGEAVLSIRSMKNDRSLWHLLKEGGRDLGTTTVEGISADVRADGDGKVNIASALARPGEGGGGKPGAVPVLPFGTLALSEGRVTVSAPGMEEVVFTIEALDLSLPSVDTPGRLLLEAATEQGGLSGDLLAKGTVEHAVGPDGKIRPLAARADVTIEAKNLPVDGIDGAAGYRGQLTAALGRSLDLRVRTTAAVEGVHFDIGATSENLRAAAKMALTASGVELTEKTAVTFTVTPLFVRTAAALRDPGSGLDLAGAVPLTVELDGLHLPLTGFDPSATGLTGSLKAGGDFHFTGIEGTGDLTVRSLSARLDSRRLAEEVDLDLFADLILGSSTGKVSLNGEVRGLFDGAGRILPQGAEVDVGGELRNVPSAFVGRFVGPPGVLAEGLGPTVDATFLSESTGGPDRSVDISVKSKRFVADASLTLGETVRLSKPAAVRATLTPKLLALLSGAGKASLAKPVDIEARIERFVLPRPRKGAPSFIPAETGIEGSLTSGRALLVLQDYGKVALGGIDVRVAAETLEEIRIDGGGTLTLPPGKGVASAVTGEGPLSFTLSGKSGFTEEGKMKPAEGAVDLGGDVLKASLAVEAVPPFERLAISSPLRLTWSGSESAVGQLFPSDPGRYSPRGPVTLSVTVSRLELPLREFSPGKAVFEGEAGVPRLVLARGAETAALEDLKSAISFDGPSNRLSADVKGLASFPGGGKAQPVSAGVALEGFIDGEEIRWKKASLALDVKGKGLPTAFAGLAAGGADRLEALAGKSIDVEASVRLAEIGGGKGEGKVSLRTPRLQAAADLAVGETITLRGPASFQLELTPESYGALFPPGPEGEESPFSLAKPAILKGRLTTLRWPRTGDDTAPGGAFEGEAGAASLLFRDGRTGETVGLENLSVTASSEDLKKVLKVSLDGTVAGEKTAGKSGSIRAEGTVSRPLAADPAGAGTGGRSSTLDLQAVGVPTALARVFSPGAALLETIAGDRADVEASLRILPAGKGGGSITVKAKAPRLKVSADLALGETIALKGPADVELLLTPASYAALTAAGKGDGEKRFELTERSSLKGRLDRLSFPRSGGGAGGAPLSGISAAGSFTADRMLYKDLKKGGTVGLEGLSLTLAADDLGGGAKISLKGKIIGSRIAEGGGGLIDVDADLAGLYSADGAFDAGGMSVKADGRTEKVPVALVDEWLGLGGMGEAALGEALDGTVKVDMRKGSGPLTIRARATHASLDIDGTVQKGVFTLRSPVTGTLDVTEDLGTQLLAKVHPLFETVYTSSDPLRIEVPADGFLLPLAGFDIKKVVVPALRLSSNRLVLRKGGLLGALIALSQQFGGMEGVGRRGDTELWFTDLVSELRGGVFSYRNRLDMLLDERLHVISWGTATLGGAGGKSSYELKLGLPAGALRKVLGTGRVSESEVLVIPLRGGEGSLDVKSIASRAALDLGRVRGQYELSAKDPIVGIIAGGIARKAIGTETGTIPPPSMSPLPWAAIVEPEPQAPAAPAEPAAPKPTEPADRTPQSREPRPAEPATPEEVIREALPDEMKGIFDILRQKR